LEYCYRVTKFSLKIIERKGGGGEKKAESQEGPKTKTGLKCPEKCNLVI
jgi:hypothetical protein